MDSQTTSGVTALAAAGVVGGLVLLTRGLGGYRSLIRVADTSSSRIDSLAAGEVRISGSVEPAEVTLVSLLQSRPCVYYRATIGGGGGRRTADSGYTEERAIGFQVRDATGTIRVFPRGARFDAPMRFEGDTGLAGDEPPGLDIRLEGSTQTSQTDRAVAAAALLEVHEADPWTWRVGRGDRGHRSYREIRLEPGDPVTIVGGAFPFSDLDDPTGADGGGGSDPPPDDPEIAADLAEARTTGSLADDPAAAWGNAAIPGFGIGRPVVAPTIDHDANALPLAGPEVAAEVARTFDIAPQTLVVAASAEVPLSSAFGIPGEVVERRQTTFMVGLLGAILAIASAMVLAVTVGRGFGA